MEIEPCIIIHVLLEFGLNLVFCFLPASDFDSGGKANKSTWGEKWTKGNLLLGPLHLMMLKKIDYRISQSFENVVL